MGLVKYSGYGLRSWFVGKKNLTLALIGMYISIVFFLNLFSTLNNNLTQFWRTDFIGGDIVHTASIPQFELTHIVLPEDYLDISEFKESNPDTDFSPRVRIGTLLEGKDSKPVILIGVDWYKEEKMGSHLGLLSGRGPLKNEKSIVIPENMIYELDIPEDGSIVVTTQTVDGYPNFDLLDIVGLHETNVALAWLTGSPFVAYADRETVLDLILADKNDASELLVSNSKKLNGSYSTTRGVRAFGVSKVLNTAYNFLGTSLIVFIIAFSITLAYYNINFSVVQRKKEMGIYMAFGASPSQVATLLFFELFLYSFICWVIGAILAGLLGILVNKLNINAITPALHILLSAPNLEIKYRLLNSITSLGLMTTAILLSAIMPVLGTIFSKDIVHSLYRAR